MKTKTCQSSSISTGHYIDGEIHLLASPGATHQRIIGQLHLILQSHLIDCICEVFLAPFDVHFKKKGIKDPDVMQPDLLVACGLAENVTAEDRYMGTPTLVFEILSDSTRTKDMIAKLNTYRLSGVEEYWLVDPKRENIVVYSFRDCEIERYKTYEAGAVAQSVVFKGLEIPLSPLFA
ncbi:MAG: Uma2 family endonuclease [Bacillota bacterium]